MLLITDALTTKAFCPVAIYLVIKSHYCVLNIVTSHLCKLCNPFSCAASTVHYMSFFFFSFAVLMPLLKTFTEMGTFTKMSENIQFTERIAVNYVTKADPVSL